MVIYENGSRDLDHGTLGVVCHPYARTWYSLRVYKIWWLWIQPFHRYYCTSLFQL